VESPLASSALPFSSTKDSFEILILGRYDVDGAL
jgi:hypothetical protein